MSTLQELGGKLPARITFIGDKKVGNKEKGTAVRQMQLGPESKNYYEVHTDRGSNIHLPEDDVEPLKE